MADMRLIDAIEAEMPYCPDTAYEIGYRNGLNMAKAIAIKLDTVPVVNGRWDDECRCTACGWYGDDIYKRLALSFDYCPNCGAKMDLEVPNGQA